MNKQFVTFEIAKKLKELGFNKKCIYLFNSTDDIPQPYISEPACWIDWNTLYVKDSNKHLLSAPLWQQVIDWFREKYNYNITYNVLEGYNGKKITNYIFKGGNIQINFKILSKKSDFFEARQQAILKTIEISKGV
jgi:hypothetical protein